MDGYESDLSSQGSSIDEAYVQRIHDRQGKEFTFHGSTICRLVPSGVGGQGYKIGPVCVCVHQSVC